MPAPVASTISANPNAIGRLSRSSGKPGALLFALVDLVGTSVKVRPQTRQRVAFSLKRVPQVGQIFVVFVLFGLIVSFVSSYTCQSRTIITFGH